MIIQHIYSAKAKDSDEIITGKSISWLSHKTFQNMTEREGKMNDWSSISDIIVGTVMIIAIIITGIVVLNYLRKDGANK